MFLLYFRLFTFSDLYWVCLSVFSCTVLFVSISQVIGCEDRLRNDLYCVEWGVKLYSIYPCSLYTTSGVRIEHPSRLVNGTVYVAVGSEFGGHFQPRDYGLSRLQLDRGRRKYPFQWRKISERYATVRHSNGSRIRLWNAKIFKVRLITTHSNSSRIRLWNAKIFKI